MIFQKPPRPALTLALLLGAGCGHAEEHAPATPPTRAQTPQRTESAPADEPAASSDAVDGALATWLQRQLVDDAHLARTTLYTWTSHEQATALAESTRDHATPRRPLLLTRDRSAGGQQSLFDRSISHDASPMARWLRRSEHRARRFAWPNAWATRMGWDGGDYGERLVQVDLRPEAWIARYDSEATPSFSAIDLEGRAISAEALNANPERVAAVYHVATVFDGRVFREFVLVNEAMLARVRVGAPETAARLEADARALDALATTLAGSSGEALSPPELLGTWRAAPAEADTRTRYLGGLAFGSLHYRPSADALRALVQVLRATPAPAVLIDYRPPERFETRRPHPRGGPPPPARWRDPTLG